MVRYSRRPGSLRRSEPARLRHDCFVGTRPRSARTCKQLGFVVSLALYAFFFDAQRGTIWGIDLPDALYRNDVTAFFGFPPSDFISSDYYPLIPYVFVMIAGYCAFNALARANRLAILSVDYTGALGRALRWMGRHSLVIYLLHQPIIFGTLYLLK